MSTLILTEYVTMLYDYNIIIYSDDNYFLETLYKLTGDIYNNSYQLLGKRQVAHLPAKFPST